MTVRQDETTLAPPAEAWSADRIAEDLVAQIDELLAEGSPAEAVARALERQGLAGATATALVAEVHRRAAPAEPCRDGECGIDAGYLWTFLGQAASEPDAEQTRLGQLRIALGRQGLGAATSAAVVQDLVADHRRIAGLHSHRMRRLGLQGIVAGVLFTAFFLWTALVAGPAGRWNLLTAAATAGLTAYSAVLYARHRSRD